MNRSTMQRLIGTVLGLMMVGALGYFFVRVDRLNQKKIEPTAQDQHICPPGKICRDEEGKLTAAIVTEKVCGISIFHYSDTPSHAICKDGVIVEDRTERPFQPYARTWAFASTPPPEGFPGYPSTRNPDVIITPKNDKPKSFCYWSEDLHYADDLKEDYICGDTVVGAARNWQTVHGESSTYWIAQAPIGWGIGTFITKEATKHKVESAR